MTGLQWWIGGRFLSPVEFAAALHGNHDYLRHFGSSLWDRNFWYVFLWLLPAGIPKLGRFPKSWLIPTGAASAMVFVLDGYYGGEPGTVGRALFRRGGTSPILVFCGSPRRGARPGRQMTWCFAHYSPFGPQKSMALALV
jgi:hypothetical protein